MTEKQQQSLNTIIAALPDDCQAAFRAVAEHAIALGYMPAAKGGGSYVDFTKSKVKRTILKINLNHTPPLLGMKFYAFSAYTGVFQEALEERVRYYAKLQYEIHPHCTGCMQRRNGRCHKPEGYTLTLPDGQQGFLCGFGIIPLPSFTAEHVPEVKAALDIQNAYFEAEG